MRLLWAGFFVLSLASGALAQANGYVRELGFEGNYRPDCWTPLLVHLESTVSEPAEYQIQVHQQDLDQDTIVYTRTVALGPQARDNVWVYFQPQPTNDGLPGPNSVTPLGDVLKVHLYDKAGKKHIANLPIQGSVKANSLDGGNGGLGSERGVKLVLVVLETANYHAQEFNNVHGVIEDTLFVPVRLDAGGLPDHVLGYQAVDAILWLDAKLNTIRNTSAFGALQQWIRQGGNFAICHQSDRSQLEALIAGDMLPVVARVSNAADAAWAIQMREKSDLDHLTSIVAETKLGLWFSQAAWKAVAATGSFEVAYATPRPDAMVDAWIYWSKEGEPEVKSPFIARRAYDLGSVTWVAQELGSGKLNGAPDPSHKPRPGEQPRILLTNGWPRIWDKVFGWRNQTRTNGELEVARNASAGTASEATYRAIANEYGRGSGVDVGKIMINTPTEHGARGTAYVFLAVVFFIVYWIIAGPGSYLYLANKKKKGMSWTVFGASAVAATLLTVALVKLLLRGGAEARHMTLVQLTPDAPAADGSPRFAANMLARLGMYIPRDGEQTVTLSDPGPDRTAAITPYAVHPQWLKDDKDAGFTDTAKYIVNTDPILAGKAPAVGFPYRSTLKKIDARWAGSVAEGIDGSASLNASNGISGTLTNNLGRDLADVYVAYSGGWVDGNSSRVRANDEILYVPVWKKGARLDLAVEAARSKPVTGMSGAAPGGTSNIKDLIGASGTTGWSAYLLRDLSGGFGNEIYDKGQNGVLRTFPLMSLIDRIGPLRREPDNGDTRPEPIARGGRSFNVSQLIASGRMVVLARAVDSPTPVPMQVNGGEFQSRGVTFYQVNLPMNRDALKPAPTTPASQPASKPTAAR